MPDDKNSIDNKLVNQKFHEKEKYLGNKLEKEAGQPIRPEKEASPEKNLEKNSDGFRQTEGMSRPELPGGIIYATKASQKQKEQEIKIEKILEEGMEDVYKKLPAQKQMEFRLAGEQTAKEINFLINKAKYSVAKILELIKKWLSIIPGVNNFFLEQEAKIKTDKIIKTKDTENIFN